MSASATHKAIAWEGGLVSRNGGASICKLVHVRTALAQRLNWHEQYEKQRQRQTEKEPKSRVVNAVQRNLIGYLAD